jgi:hypothetical protein
MKIKSKLNIDNGLQDLQTEQQAVCFIAVIVRVSAFQHLINFRVNNLGYYH